MRGSVAWILASAVVACNAVSGVNDLTVVDCVACDDAGGGPDAGIADGGVAAKDTGVTQPRDTGAADAVVDGPPQKPSYCTGITFNAPLDVDMNSAAGQNPTTNDPTIMLVPGKYSNAAALTTQAIFYDATVKLLHNKDVGSVAMWVKPTFTLKVGDNRPTYKPRTGQGSAANNAGPGFSIEGLTVVMSNQDGTVATTTLDATQVAAAWTPTAFMLFVGTWNRTGTPVGGPTLTITLSSTTSSVGSATTDTWLPANDVKFIRVGSQNTATQMLVDDVTLWNRQLGAQEIKDLYAAPAAVVATCGL